MKVLVTGGAGFIGSNLAKRLAQDGHAVTAADSFAAAHFLNLSDFTGDVLTLRDSEDVDSMRKLGAFDVIFHQASITGVVGADGGDLSNQSIQHRMMRNNVETFRAILDWAVESKARVVWASSCSVYGRGPVPMKESQPTDPLNVYAFSKLTMERMAARYSSLLSHPIVGLRYTNVYGPGEAHKGKLASMIHQLAKQMRGGNRPRIFTPGDQKRDFVYIEDAVEGNLLAARAGKSGVYNIGCGQAFTFNQLIAELNRALQTDLKPDYFQNPYSFTQDWTQADLASVRADLGFVPKFELPAGIDAYMASGKLGTDN